MDKWKHVILGVGLIAFATALWPAAGYAATQTSDNTGDTPSEPSVTLSRSIEAGKRVSNRALSSKAKAANAEAAKTEAAKPELTDFQKKIAAITKEKEPSKGKTLSDFGTQAASPAKKTPDASKASAVKKAESAKAPAQATEAEKVPMVEMTKKGTVTGVSPQGFALEYAVDKKAGGMEIWFNYNEDMKFAGMGGTSELGEGDTVYVVYDQAPNKSRVVKEMTLLKKKPKESEAM